MNQAQQLIANHFAGLLPFDDVPTGELQVKDPLTGGELGLVIELMGPEHPERKKVSFAADRKRREAMTQAGKIVLDDPADEDAAEPARLASLTLGWRATREGATLPEFTAATAVALYTAKPWLRAQVKAALDQRERFIKRFDAS